MDGPYSRGASDEADCSSTNWDLHTGKETIYQTPIYELNTNFRVYGLKQKCMYLEALKLVSIFQQGKLAALWIFSLYFQFIVRLAYQICKAVYVWEKWTFVPGLQVI